MEQLFLIAIFLLVGLVNVIVRWLRQRAEARRPEAEPEARPVPGPAPSRPRELPPGARVVLTNKMPASLIRGSGGCRLWSCRSGAVLGGIGGSAAAPTSAARSS